MKIKRRKKKNKNIFIVLFFVLIISTILATFYSKTLKSPVDINDTSNIELTIEQGSSGIIIANILKDNKLIRSRKYFLYYAKKSNLNNFKSGVYYFSKSQNLDEILAMLNTGARPIGEKITIPEGYDINQIATVLENAGLANKDRFIELTKDKNIFSDKFTFLQDSSITQLEGFMYPETYFIEKGTDEIDIISMFLSETQRVFKQNNVLNDFQHIADINNINKLLTLASIVERETANENERDIVAGIFINRLNINMPLQSCVTVEYILGKQGQRLSYEDTQIDSPYNTYINKGLPPTPICTPTISSINAVKNYKATDYLFFVAKLDGSHVFSKTYDEHLKATKEIYGQY